MLFFCMTYKIWRFFQYGRAEVAQNRSKIINDAESEEEEEDERREQRYDSAEKRVETASRKEVSQQLNGKIQHDNNLISRDNLILGPDPSMNVNSAQNNYSLSKKENSPQDEDNNETMSTVTETSLVRL